MARLFPGDTLQVQFAQDDIEFTAGAQRKIAFADHIRYHLNVKTGSLKKVGHLLRAIRLIVNYQ